MAKRAENNSANDDPIQISIPRGARAQKIRNAHEVSKDRRRRMLQQQLEQSSDPQQQAQLQQMITQIDSETVANFIIGHFKAVCLAEERQLKQQELQQMHQQQMETELQDHLQQFRDI